MIHDANRRAPLARATRRTTDNTRSIPPDPQPVKARPGRAASVKNGARIQQGEKPIFFTRADWEDMFTPAGLARRAGVPEHRIWETVAKELTDNALDAAPGSPVSVRLSERDLPARAWDALAAEPELWWKRPMDTAADEIAAELAEGAR